MAAQRKEQLTLPCDPLEWLYVPDVVYAEYETCKRHLQLIIPYRPVWDRDQRYPLILFIPGSAWFRQEVYNSIPAYAKMAERGFVMAILQFRESTLAPFPAQVQDTKAALRFLAQKAGDFHIDTSSMFLAGNSSGGHIALLTGLTSAHNMFDTSLYTGVSADIRGIIACSAPTDILRCAPAPMPPGTPRPTARLLGVTEVQQHPALAKAASCAPYITREAKLPPILLLHGTEDSTVSIENSRALFSLLRNADKEVSYYELLGAGHGGAVYWSEPVLNLIEQFIRHPFQVN